MRLSRSLLMPTLFTGVVAALFLGSWAGKASLRQAGAPPDCSPSGAPRRIVSLAPSITEMLFILGLGERVVGVTRYCNYPDEAAELPRVGGHLDPNFEAILRMRPGLVVLLDEQRELAEALDELGVRSLTVSDNSAEHILEALAILGTRCGAAGRAEELVANLRARMAAVRERTAALPRPKVLVIIDRALDAGSIEDAYVAGRDDYFEPLVEMAGGRNAYQGPAVPYPVVSLEGMITMAPEVIIDLAAGRTGERAERYLADWRQVPHMEAVRQGRIYAIPSDYAMIPGPRFILLLEALAERIHPE